MRKHKYLILIFQFSVLNLRALNFFNWLKGCWSEIFVLFFHSFTPFSYLLYFELPLLFKIHYWLFELMDKLISLKFQVALIMLINTYKNVNA